MTRRTSHWDALARLQKAGELGMTFDSLRPFLSHIEAPAVVVGTGAGAIQADLQSHGVQAIGFDLSVPMLRSAQRTGPLHLAAAEARRLPLPDRRVGTVVLTSGVLDTLIRRRERIDAVREALRVLAPDGVLLVGLFAPACESRWTGAEIGYMKGWTQDQSRIHAIWAAGPDPDAWAKLVAEWRGVGPAVARIVVDRHRSTIEAIRSALDAVHESAASTVDANETLRDAFQFSLVGQAPGEHEALLTECGATIHDVFWEPHVSTLTVCAGPHRGVGSDRRRRGAA